MKSVYLFVFIFFFAFDVHKATAQVADQRDREAFFDQQVGFESYIERYINEKDTTGTGVLCLKSCVFVKFRVDAKGQIINVACNINTPEKLCEFISAAVQSSNGKWKPKLVDGKAVLSQEYILPIIVHLSSRGCTVKDDTENSAYNMLLFDKRVDTADKRKRVQIPPVDCILFNPIFYMRENQWPGIR